MATPRIIFSKSGLLALNRNQCLASTKTKPNSSRTESQIWCAASLESFAVQRDTAVAMPLKAVNRTQRVA